MLYLIAAKNEGQFSQEPICNRRSFPAVAFFVHEKSEFKNQIFRFYNKLPG